MTALLSELWDLSTANLDFFWCVRSPFPSFLCEPKFRSPTSSCEGRVILLRLFASLFRFCMSLPGEAGHFFESGISVSVHLFFFLRRFFCREYPFPPYLFCLGGVVLGVAGAFDAFFFCSFFSCVFSFFVWFWVYFCFLACSLHLFSVFFDATKGLPVPSSHCCLVAERPCSHVLPFPHSDLFFVSSPCFFFSPFRVGSRRSGPAVRLLLPRAIDAVFLSFIALLSIFILCMGCIFSF